jgi:LysM repeat protein
MKYIVQPWETWESIDTIVSRFGLTLDQLVKVNPFLDSVPLRPGMTLEIPGHEIIDLPAQGYLEYLVQPDDSLYSIANRFKLDYNRVIAQNPQIKNPTMIWPGQIIYLLYWE